MAPGESRAKRGNQATHSRITWFREEHNLYGDCCNFGEMPSLVFSGFFGAKLQKTSRCSQRHEMQRLELCRNCGLQRVNDLLWLTRIVVTVNASLYTPMRS